VITMANVRTEAIVAATIETEMVAAVEAAITEALSRKEVLTEEATITTRTVSNKITMVATTSATPAATATMHPAMLVPVPAPLTSQARTPRIRSRSKELTLPFVSVKRMPTMVASSNSSRVAPTTTTRADTITAGTILATTVMVETAATTVTTITITMPTRARASTLSNNSSNSSSSRTTMVALSRTRCRTMPMQMASTISLTSNLPTVVMET